MNNEITIKQEIAGAISQQVNPVDLAKKIYPRMERALQLAINPQETNEIRSQIETVNIYIQRSLPKLIKERKDQFLYTHEGDMLYLRASEKAGALWKVCEEKRPSGVRDDRSESFPTLISAVDAGFKSSRDATSYERISEINEEDWRTYEEETKKEMRQATLNGMENIWRMLYREEPNIELPDGIFQVIYADPPWQYDNSGFEEAADNLYSTMPIDSICDLPIKKMTNGESVLFMWSTNPLLPEALQVVTAWGFEYKTNMAWVKDRGRGKGWFLKSKHELLIIATQSGTPQPEYRPDSCFEADRGNIHSRKPEIAYKIIEKMYKGPKVELFARIKREGWESWGNEII